MPYHRYTSYSTKKKKSDEINFDTSQKRFKDFNRNNKTKTRRLKDFRYLA